MTEGLHVASKDVLDLPGLDVKSSSYRCPESFFVHDGLWPARRLAFTERLFGLVLRAAAPRCAGATSHGAWSSMETSDSASSDESRWMEKGTEGKVVGVWPEQGRGAEPGLCRTFLSPKSGDEPGYPGIVTHPKALLAGLLIS